MSGTREVTGTVLKSNGDPWPNVNVEFDLKSGLATTATDIVDRVQVVKTTDDNGDFSADLAVPDSGSWRWKCTRPDTQSFFFWLAAGDPITISEILIEVVGESGESIPSIADLVAAHAALTENVHGISDTDDLVYASDSRLSNSRTPTAHAATHATDGSDPMSPGDIGAIGDADSDGTPYSRQSGGWVAALRTSIANTWSAVQTFSAVVTGVIKPAADATDAIQIQDAGGTAVVTVDTINGAVAVGGNPNSTDIIRLFKDNGDAAFYARASDGKMFFTGSFAIGDGTFPLTIVYDGTRSYFQTTNGRIRINATDSSVGEIEMYSKGQKVTVFSGLNVNMFGNLIMPNMPITDPGIAGALWNNSGVVKISAG